MQKALPKQNRPAGPEQGMQNGSKSLFCGQPAPAGAQQCPAAKQQQGKQDVPPDAAGQREQKAVFLPDGTGKHIHMVHKEQPQAVPPQKLSAGRKALLAFSSRHRWQKIQMPHTLMEAHKM